MSYFSQHPAIACLAVIINMGSAVAIPSFAQSLKPGEYFFSFLWTMVVTCIGMNCSKTIVLTLMIIRVCRDFYM